LPPFFLTRAAGLQVKECKYKHALPKGFVLKKDKKRMDKEREEISIEDLVEKERGNLGTTAITKVTLETFVAWKRKKMQQRAEQEKKEKVKKKT
jgi:hypothetical protein